MPTGSLDTAVDSLIENVSNKVLGKPVLEKEYSVAASQLTAGWRYPAIPLTNFAPGVCLCRERRNWTKALIHGTVDVNTVTVCLYVSTELTHNDIAPWVQV